MIYGTFSVFAWVCLNDRSSIDLDVLGPCLASWPGNLANKVRGTGAAVCMHQFLSRTHEKRIFFISVNARSKDS